MLSSIAIYVLGKGIADQIAIARRYRPYQHRIMPAVLAVRWTGESHALTASAASLPAVPFNGIDKKRYGTGMPAQLLRSPG